MEPDDFWCPLQCAKHDDNSPILLEMSDRFDSATGKVQIRYLMVTDDPLCVATFRRTVDVTVGGERCCGNEKYLLLSNPLCDIGIDGVVNFPHKICLTSEIMRLRQEN